MTFKKIISVIIIHFCLILFAQQKEINIKEFGVSGNDRLDDTKNFDFAIDFISKNGGILYVPKGDYFLDNKNRNREGIYNNSYIFLIKTSFKIRMDKEAVLHYKNGFKGFRFRTTQDPTDKTINKYEVEIQGGIVDGSQNNITKVKDNPNIWAFVGETLKKFKVSNMIIKNLYGSAGITSFSNDYAEISGNSLENVTGNPDDYIDNHGNGVYIGDTKAYEVNNNKIINNLKISERIGTVGICIEGGKSGNGMISNNFVSGYDRGIHVELINGTSNIIKNQLIGNVSGVVLWNNNGHKQVLESNIINNKGLNKNIKPILYTSAPILILGYNANSGTIIKNNTITIEKDFFIQNNIMQITSDRITVINNVFSDNSKTLSLSISQGEGDKKRINGVVFSGNKIVGAKIYVYDGTNINISNNEFDINEAVISFDTSKNVYKNNTFLKGRIPHKIQLLGKYTN